MTVHPLVTVLLLAAAGMAAPSIAFAAQAASPAPVRTTATAPPIRLEAAPHRTPAGKPAAPTPTRVPVREVSPAAIAGFEIPVTDVGRAKKFYGDLFGWTFSSPAWDAKYILIHTGTPGVLGGFAAKVGRGNSTGTTLFIKVADLDAALSRARKSGAAIEQGKTMIGAGDGYYAMIRDPDRNMLGLEQSK